MYRGPPMLRLSRRDKRVVHAIDARIGRLQARYAVGDRNSSRVCPRPRSFGHIRLVR
jgi:hypothetical protein